MSRQSVCLLALLLLAAALITWLAGWGAFRDEPSLPEPLPAPVARSEKTPLPEVLPSEEPPAPAAGVRSVAWGGDAVEVSEVATPEPPADGPWITIRVVDEMTRAPLPRAQVEVDGKPREIGTDATLRVGYEPPMIVYLLVRAAGHLPTRFRLVDDSIEGSPDVPDSVTLLVPPSAELRGTIRDAAGIPRAGERLSVWKYRGPGPVTGGEDSTGFVMRELPRSWEARADANGAFRFAALPAGVKLTGSWFFKQWPDPAQEVLFLSPGEIRHLQLVTAPTGTLRGQVLDVRGSPVTGASVTARVTRGAATIGFRNWGRSDARGRFTLTEVPAGKGTVVVSPASRSPSGTEFAPIEVPFAVTRQGELVDCTVVVHPGLAICGTVLDPAGVPCAGVRVELADGVRDDPGWYPNDRGPQARSGPGGAFRLAPATPGEHTVVARGSGMHGDSPPVKAMAGADDVRLKLTEACAVDGEVVGRTPPVGTPARIALYPREGGGTARRIYTDARGGFHLKSLSPGEYDLVATCSDGRIGFHFDLRLIAGQPCQGLRVVLQPGGKLQLDGDTLIEHLRVEWRGHTVYEDDVCRPAVSVPILVPSGRVRIRGLARWIDRQEAVPIECTVDVDEGKTVGVNLAPAR